MELLREIWFFTREVAAYLIGGFLLAGLLRAFLTERTVARHLGGTSFWPVLKASLLGMPLPLCSCSVLPIAATLRKGGASRGATSSFLISTPETGVDSVAVSYAMLDPLLTIARPVAALITALATGSLDLLTDPARKTPPTPAADPPPDPIAALPLGRRIIKGVRYSFFSLFADLAWYLAWGLVLAGLVSWLLPADFFQRLPGGWFAAAGVIVGIGVPLYICATSSTPLAAALIAKGLSPGLALVLLLVGPATNISSLTVIWRILGPRSTAVYLGGIVLSALTLGLLLDRLYLALGLDFRSAALGTPAELFPGWLETAAAIALLALIAYGIHKEKIRPILRRRARR